MDVKKILYNNLKVIVKMMNGIFGSEEKFQFWNIIIVITSIVGMENIFFNYFRGYRMMKVKIWFFRDPEFFFRIFP